MARQQVQTLKSYVRFLPVVIWPLDPWVHIRGQEEIYHRSFTAWSLKRSNSSVFLTIFLTCHRYQVLGEAAESLRVSFSFREKCRNDANKDSSSHTNKGWEVRDGHEGFWTTWDSSDLVKDLTWGYFAPISAGIYLTRPNSPTQGRERLWMSPVQVVSCIKYVWRCPP